ncbi:hypothetical protein PAECIP111892_05467 [Paenibacillus auburnensis]|uniref:Uncharacterized protein n=1 Tax=Paenibacillus auburnensis TaxID=2905649 RepID=A0ABM9CU59_9BACL|nr:hypothetical protein [Paenibacillus auburnensis]CAH1224301.1 hypothetical protein PAECIP111892_05467 [Paenibacillus auburnensis]
MKKRILIPIAMSLLLCLPIYAGAEEVHSATTPQKNNVEVVKAYRAVDGGLKEITLEEYNKLEAEANKNAALEQAKVGLAESAPLFKTNSLITPMDAYTTTVYKYNQSGYIYNYARSDLNRRISSAVKNDSNNPVTRAIAYTASQAFAANISFNVSAKINAVTAGITAGATWTNTYTSSDTVTQSISPGYYAWMDYYPIFNNSYGLLNEKVYANAQGTSVLVSDTNTYADIYVARVMSGGLPDGVYTVKQSLSAPSY